MVRIIEGKLIIEIETSNQIANLLDYQNAIIDVLQNYTEDISNGGFRTTSYSLGMLLSELMPTLEQNEVLYKGQLAN